MTAPSLPRLGELPLYPYLTPEGTIDPQWQQKIGVYGIFDDHEILQFIGYSRNVFGSLQQHLVRCPQQCYGYRLSLCDRPSRTLLEDIRQAWIAETGQLPPGNGDDFARWTQAIDVRPHMTAAEQKAYPQGDELEQRRLLKQIARRIEGEIFTRLQQRGVTMELRFNPKLKEEGLLDLKT